VEPPKHNDTLNLLPMESRHFSRIDIHFQIIANPIFIKRFSDNIEYSIHSNQYCFGDGFSAVGAKPSTFPLKRFLFNYF